MSWLSQKFTRRRSTFFIFIVSILTDTRQLFNVGWIKLIALSSVSYHKILLMFHTSTVHSSQYKQNPFSILYSQLGRRGNSLQFHKNMWTLKFEISKNTATFLSHSIFQLCFSLHLRLALSIKLNHDEIIWLSLYFSEHVSALGIHMSF